MVACLVIQSVRQAYIQSQLKTSDRQGRSVDTWISLPPELQPAEWKQLPFRDPVVKLVKALYGHPDSGGLWERHLKAALTKLGFTEIDEHKSSFWHPKHKCLLTAYVDDILCPVRWKLKLRSGMTSVTHV